MGLLPEALRTPPALPGSLSGGSCCVLLRPASSGPSNRCSPRGCSTAWLGRQLHRHLLLRCLEQRSEAAPALRPGLVWTWPEAGSPRAGLNPEIAASCLWDWGKSFWLLGLQVLVCKAGWPTPPWRV